MGFSDLQLRKCIYIYIYICIVHRNSSKCLPPIEKTVYAALTGAVFSVMLENILLRYSFFTNAEVFDYRQQQVKELGETY